MIKIIVMGVAGCGKSSVGGGVATKLNAHYLDGDDLHPPENIKKMSAGTPLDDVDRAPWLDLVGEHLSRHQTTILIGCSALKRSYRDRIRAQVTEPVIFLHLHGDRSVIEARMAARKEHFMPVKLLDSQFAALETLQDDELSVIIDINQPFEDVISDAVHGLQTSGV
ncbi:MAG: gluconokinase [Litoreibacter sp.]